MAGNAEQSPQSIRTVSQRLPLCFSAPHGVDEELMNAAALKLLLHVDSAAFWTRETNKVLIYSEEQRTNTAVVHDEYGLSGDSSAL